MKLFCVTLTGADDNTPIYDLQSITKQYPFVEWGILISPDRAGSERYPGPVWLARFGSYFLPWAAHLCGEAVTQFVVNGGYALARRVQLNFNLERKPHLQEFVDFVIQREYTRAGFPIICQINAANQALAANPNVQSILFDGSGGRGIAPSFWPEPIAGKCCGYAGGLGPENLEAQLHAIEEVVGKGKIWVDMEGCLRTAGRFDLEKAVACLEIAKKWVSR